jgi:ABC-type polysaccharide/polyol phosphate export permease
VRKTAFSHTDMPLYPVYLLIGLVIMGYMNRVIGIASDIIRGNSGFIKSIHVPSEVLVLSTIFHVFFLHIFEVGIIIALGIYFGVSITGVILYICSVLLFTLFLLGIAFIFSTIGVFVSDISNVWAIVSQFVFFITPTFYMLENGTRLYYINQFNPLYHFMNFSREALISGSVSMYTLIVSIICVVFSLCIGLGLFSRFKIKFAELL